MIRRRMDIVTKRIKNAAKPAPCHRSGKSLRATATTKVVADRARRAGICATASPLATTDSCA
jgi:hypothetical protein